MDSSLITEIVAYGLAVVGAARLIAQGIARVTEITPTTRDDAIITAAQVWIRRIQRVLETASVPGDGADKKSGAQ